MWVLIGVPVAALIAAFRIFVWVILALPDMAATAAVLGAVQGLWLYLAGCDERSRQLRWLGAASGGILGLLGFPPVFSHINSVVADRLMVGIFISAAVCGGIAAGLALSRRVVGKGSRSPMSARGIAVGCVLLMLLAVIDYQFYWSSTADRLPVSRVSRQTIANLSAGNAEGSTWAGCYQYLGRYSRGSGVLGGEGGVLRVEESNGSLRVLDASANPLLGGVDRNGSFRFGAERTTGQDTLRVFWEGKFNENSLTLTRRITVLRGMNVLNTTRLRGTGKRIPC